MAGAIRCLLAFLIGTLLWASPAQADEQAPPPATNNAPAPVTEDAVRLLELGKLLMGQNNPAYAARPVLLSAETRNGAREQALRTFQSLVKRYPQYADGWLWLGISLTEGLRYTKDAPDGQPVATEASITEGINAFRMACDRNPTDLVAASYYGEAMMAYRKDFDAARAHWEHYLTVATSDLQKMTALVQAARACLNKAYFGKADKMSQEEITALFQAATDYVQRAAKICPKSADVREMQQLLQQHRKTLLGK